MQRFCADVNSLYKRKCWTNSVVPQLIHSSELQSHSENFARRCNIFQAVLLRVFGKYDITVLLNLKIGQFCIIAVQFFTHLPYFIKKSPKRNSPFTELQFLPVLLIKIIMIFKFQACGRHFVFPILISKPTFLSRSGSAEPPRIPGGSVQRGTCGTHFRLVTSLPFFFIKIPLELLMVSGSQFWQFCKLRKKFCLLFRPSLVKT